MTGAAQLARAIAAGELSARAAVQASLDRIEALGHKRREADHIEAKARIAGIADCLEPLGEQAADTGGIAHRLAGAGLDAMHLAVGAEQRRLQAPRALAARLQ